MASLTKKELQDFIIEVSKLRDTAYENALEHAGAIKAAEHFIWKLDSEAEQPKKKVRKGRRGLPPPPDLPEQQREGE
jgi:hypothetical protein